MFALGTGVKVLVILVAGDGAVDDSSYICVEDDERQLNDRPRRGRCLRGSLTGFISLNQVLKSNLLFGDKQSSAINVQSWTLVYIRTIDAFINTPIIHLHSTIFISGA